MKFLLTMHMPSNQGKPVHQITCEIKGVTNIVEFYELLHRNDFIIVDEYYYDAEDRFQSAGKYKLRGTNIVNCAFIGKIRVLEER
jgi:hypothetical protein